MANESRNIAVFLHADWCKYCKNMEQTTFKNKRVIELLENTYYFISFDGEQKESVNFQGNQFDYIPSGRHYGTHEIATTLGTIDEQLTYPVFVILNAKNDIVFQYASFIDAPTLISILEETNATSH